MTTIWWCIAGLITCVNVILVFTRRTKIKAAPEKMNPGRALVHAVCEESDRWAKENPGYKMEQRKAHANKFYKSLLAEADQWAQRMNFL
jgi:hypothetical protein